MYEEPMVEFVLNYLAERGHHADSQEELDRLRRGIRIFLRDHGVSRSEHQPFYRGYVRRRLERVAQRDLKRFFLHYGDIHAIREELLDHRGEPGALPPQSRRNCLCALERIAGHPGLEKYLPVRELRRKNIWL